MWDATQVSLNADVNDHNLVSKGNSNHLEELKDKTDDIRRFYLKAHR